MIRDTDCIKSLSRNRYRRNDIYPVVENNLPVLVCAVTEFVHFIGRTENGIQVIKEKECPDRLAVALASVQSISVVTEYQEFRYVRKKP